MSILRRIEVSRASLLAFGAAILSGTFVVMARAESSIPFADSFENYTDIIVATNGIGTNGWAGTDSPEGVTNIATAFATNYSAAYLATPPSYPIDYDHAGGKVMQFQTAGAFSNAFATNLYVADTNNLNHYVYIDTMLRPGYVNADPPMDADVRVGVYVNTNGNLKIYHTRVFEDAYGDPFGNPQLWWTEVPIDHTIASDEWVRVTITMDYLSSATNVYSTPGDPDNDYSLFEHYFQIRINGGEPLTNEAAFSSPTPSSVSDFGGSWFLAAHSGYANRFDPFNRRFFSGIGLQGVGFIDDVVVTTNEIVFGTAWSIAVSAGAGGSISPAGPNVLVAEGADKTFTITASNSYSIADVVVDGTSVGPTNSYTFISVVTNHTIAATFQGGLSPLEIWLSLYDLQNDPDGDADGDGVSNRQEYYAGTDPTSTNSVFRIIKQAVGASNGSLAFYATTNSGVTNSILIFRSTNLLQGAGWVEYDAASTRDPSGTNWWTETNFPAGAPVYYQLRIPTNM